MYSVDWLLTFAYLIVSTILVLMFLVAKVIMLLILKKDKYINDIKYILWCDLLPMYCVGYFACWAIIENTKGVINA